MKLGISLDHDLSHCQSVPDSESQELAPDGLGTPIALRSQRLRAESEPGSLLGVGVDPQRWKIISVTGAGDSALVVLDILRDGLALRDVGGEES